MVEYSFKLAPYCTIRICLVLMPDHGTVISMDISSK